MTENPEIINLIKEGNDLLKKSSDLKWRILRVQDSAAKIRNLQPNEKNFSAKTKKLIIFQSKTNN